MSSWKSGLVLLVGVTCVATASCGSDDSGGGSGAGGTTSTGGATSGGGTTSGGGATSGGGTTGSGGAAGAQADGGVDLNELGKPCVADKCPAGLTPVTYCGLAGCSAGQFCSCEIPCDKDPKVCPPGSTCVTIADGPGTVCMKS